MQAGGCDKGRMGRVEINNRSKVKGQRSKVKNKELGSSPPQRNAGAEIKDLVSRCKGKVVMIGVGNPLKGDDGAGPFFIKQLKKWDCPSPSGRKGLSQIFLTGRNKKGTVPVLVDAGEVPENYTGAITKAKPDTILIVDAADFGGKPGEIKMFGAGEINKAGFTTHSMSLNVFTEYLKQETGAEILLLAIQPKTVKPGVSLSQEDKTSIGNIIQALV